LDGDDRFLVKLHHQLLLHNIKYAEELFSYYPANLTLQETQIQKDHETFQEWLTYMVPPDFHPYLERVWTKTNQNQSLTKGHIILRQGIIIKHPSTNLLSEVLHLTTNGDDRQDSQVVTREYSSKRLEYTMETDNPKAKRCHAMSIPRGISHGPTTVRHKAHY
jgi:hypothetical protein